MTTSSQAVTRALSPGNQPASQATRVEQSRAMAEVQAMVVVARQAPRDETRAIQRATEACRMGAVAERAFFKFPRGGQTVSGPSVHLAVELARCWGNVTYGLAELERDDMRGQSEMVAYAWDLETNTRAATSFIVPHKRDKKGGAEVLVEMRDIYENNANMGARRLREMIFRILPPYLVEMGKDACRETLEGGGGEPLPTRIAKCLKLFADIGISRERIEAKIGGPADHMTPVDLANLGVSYQSIRRGEVDAAEEFPTTSATTVADALRPEPAMKAPAPAGYDPATGEIHDETQSGAPSPAPEAAAAPPLPASGPAAATSQRFGASVSGTVLALPDADRHVDAARQEFLRAAAAPPQPIPLPKMPDGKTVDWVALSTSIQVALMDAPDLETIETIRSVNRAGLNTMFKANPGAYKAVVATAEARKGEINGAGEGHA